MHHLWIWFPLFSGQKACQLCWNNDTQFEKCPELVLPRIHQMRSFDWLSCFCFMPFLDCTNAFADGKVICIAIFNCSWQMGCIKNVISWSICWCSFLVSHSGRIALSKSMQANCKYYYKKTYWLSAGRWWSCWWRSWMQGSRWAQWTCCTLELPFPKISIFWVSTLSKEFAISTVVVLLTRWWASYVWMGYGILARPGLCSCPDWCQIEKYLQIKFCDLRLIWDNLGESNKQIHRAQILFLASSLGHFWLPFIWFMPAHLPTVHWYYW